MKKDFITRQEHRQPLRHLYGWLKSLQSTVIFMQTGAHPDDETSRMLARLSLGDGMHVVYVNAVRGQGGQNALGPERGDALGYLRSEELFEAMKVIRADIGWLAETPDDPIRDFGFSKSAEQTYEHWGKTHTLRQMVKMVRLFRPDILIPTFLDVPGQHGHHRAVTQTTLAAFDEAARADSFDDLGLPVWQVNALYLPAWGGGGGSYDDEVPPPDATHEILTGDYDPVLGGTYAQVGEWSRACHATQGMGRPVDEEERPVPLHQLRTASGTPVHSNLTEGVPETLAALAAHCNADADGSSDAGPQAASRCTASRCGCVGGIP
jgi:LmbE family N-acetylglucosaminyl deacetylase